MVLRCKMCGGILANINSSGVCECEYCGTRQSIPFFYDDECTEMYNKANYFRQNSEFDKAEQLYEMITEKNPDNAEAYWSMLLCRYGVEYVKDPVTQEYFPTCHRVKRESVLNDDNYIRALSSSSEQLSLFYTREASRLERIRKKIIEIADQEQPFDIFICYKETDEKGSRTIDSVKAQELYDSLVSKGYKVFFSRITLEDKLGHSYEPYIFSALSTARIMLIVGSSPYNINSTWVRNEWGRYIDILRKDDQKMIVSCITGMKAKDLPEKLRYFQVHDLDENGALQEIIGSITRLLPPTSAKNNNTETSAEVKKFIVSDTITHIISAIDEENWQSADQYCGKLIMADPDTNVVYFFKSIIAYKTNGQVSMFINRLKQAYPELTEQEKGFITQKRSADYFYMFLYNDCLSRAEYIGHKYPNVFDIDCTPQMEATNKKKHTVYCSVLNYTIYILKNLDLAEKLLRCGANPNTSCRVEEIYGNGIILFKTIHNPLDDAILTRDIRFVSQLLYYGANPNIPCRVTRSPTQEIVEQTKLIKFARERAYLANDFRSELKKVDLLENELRENAAELPVITNSNALSLVIDLVKDIDMFTLLLDSGADPNFILNYENDTYPAIFSMLSLTIIKWCSKQAVMQLINHGAHWDNVILYKNIRRTERNYPYHKVLNLNRDFINFLKQAGWKGSWF